MTMDALQNVEIAIAQQPPVAVVLQQIVKKISDWPRAETDLRRPRRAMARSCGRTRK